MALPVFELTTVPNMEPLFLQPPYSWGSCNRFTARLSSCGQNTGTKKHERGDASCLFISFGFLSNMFKTVSFIPEILVTYRTSVNKQRHFLHLIPIPQGAPPASPDTSSVPKLQRFESPPTAPVRLLWARCRALHTRDSLPHRLDCTFQRATPLSQHTFGRCHLHSQPSFDPHWTLVPKKKQPPFFPSPRIPVLYTDPFLAVRKHPIHQSRSSRL